MKASVIKIRERKIAIIKVSTSAVFSLSPVLVTEKLPLLLFLPVCWFLTPIVP